MAELTRKSDNELIEEAYQIGMDVLRLHSGADVRPPATCPPNTRAHLAMVDHIATHRAIEAVLNNEIVNHRGQAK